MKSFRMLMACCVVWAVSAGGSAPSMAQTPPGVGPLEKQAKPITPENPIPRRVNYEPAPYPVDEQTGARGTVTVMITLDEAGRIGEARVARTSLRLSNPAVSMTLTQSTANDEAKCLVNRSVEQSNAVRAGAKAFREAALQSVQQWRYDPPAAAPIAFPVDVTFAPPGTPEGTPAGRPSTDAVGAE